MTVYQVSLGKLKGDSALVAKGEAEEMKGQEEEKKGEADHVKVIMYPMDAALYSYMPGCTPV